MKAKKLYEVRKRENRQEEREAKGKVERGMGYREMREEDDEGGRRGKR